MASKTADAAETVTLEAISAPFIGGQIPNADAGIRAIVDLTQKAGEIDILDLPTAGLGDGLPASVPIVVDHRSGGQLGTVKALVEQYRLRPERRTGTAVVTTLQSFIDLVNRHKDDSTVIFASTKWPEPKLIAVVDYHELDGKPRHGKHRIEYRFPVTEEFKVWIDNNGELMEQAKFAAFLEDHAAELTTPFDGERSDYERLFKEKFATPNELIALSRDLEIYVGAKVKRAERLASGERTVEFVEEHLNTKGEKVQIPGVFMIAVPAFLDGEAVRIPTRLRYRAGGGSISWAYQLYRWEFWLRDRVKEDLDKAAKDTGLPSFEGSPEA